MLTAKQKERLHPFTLHTLFGEMLIDAMVVWETTNPAQLTFGVAPNSNHWESSIWEVDKSDKGCCLVGASIVGKKANDVKIGVAASTFKINKTTIWLISDGFDSSYDNNEDEAFQFGRNVSRILFDE